MVGGDSVGNILHQDGLTRFGLCHQQGTLSFADGGKQVYDACRKVVVMAFTKFELFIGEKRSEMFKRHSVSHVARSTTVDFRHSDEREILFTGLRRAYGRLYDITGFKAEQFYL